MGPRSRLAPAAFTAAVAACLATAGCSGAAPGTLLGSPKAAATSAAIAPHNPLSGPPADPFAGTPAAHWTDGAAGIVLPAAKPVGSFTQAQVKLAYEWTRKLLIAAELDKQTLDGGTPTAFANLLNHSDRKWFLDGLNATAGTYKGAKVLNIHVDYLFAYAVEPPHQPERWMRLVSNAAWLLQFGNWLGDATTFEPSYNVAGDDGISGNSCGNTDGFVHPDWPSVVPSVVPQPSDSGSGAPINPYALGQTRTGTCENTTGT